MKTLISLIFCAVIMIMAAPAQSQEVKFTPGETYRSWTRYLASDTVLTNTEKGKVFLVDVPKAYTYIVTASATNGTLNKAHVFTLYGSIDGVKWYSVTTAAWKATTADTTVIFNSGTTAVNWRFLKPSLKANASGARAKLGAQHVKIGL